MIVLVVMEELERHFLDVHQIEENLWTLGSREKYYGSQRNDRTLAMSVAPAPGGAYSYFGWLAVGDAEVVLTLKTVRGIMRHW